MTRSTRMLLMHGGKEKERRRRMGIEYEDTVPVDRYGPYMPTTVPYMPMEPESAFYDDRGRRHYDNGRYAPMSSYMPMEPWAVSLDRRMESGRREAAPRMIGFDRGWKEQDMRSDATIPNMIEMDQLRGKRDMQGMARGYGLPQFDQRMALEWTSGMVNADGTKGAHWPLEKTKEVQKQYGVDCDPLVFYAVLNSIYSDYCEALKKNNASTLETYVCLTKAWINDTDAVPDKAAAYFTYIVEH